ncbi:hypothetical protein B1M_41313, partial [Burkholderia sp. TJI49]
YNRASGDLGRYANQLGALTGRVEVELSRLLDAGEARPDAGGDAQRVDDTRRHDARAPVAGAQVATSGA